MKITVFNGSPKGEGGNTNIMVSAFLEGARLGGAETESIFLNEKIINHCKGCGSCIMSGQSICAIQDDMGDLVRKFVESDIVVLATPLYIDNISGILKVFIDRLFCIGNPRYDNEKDQKGEYRFGRSERFRNGVPPKVVIISSGGYPHRTAFQAVALWADSFTRHFHLDLIAEIYTTQATVFALSKAGIKEYQTLVGNFRSLLNKAGQEIVTDGKLSEETQGLLDTDFMPAEHYIQLNNKLADMMPTPAQKDQSNEA